MHLGIGNVKLGEIFNKNGVNPVCYDKLFAIVIGVREFADNLVFPDLQLRYFAGFEMFFKVTGGYRLNGLLLYSQLMEKKDTDDCDDGVNQVELLLLFHVDFLY